MAKLQCPQCGVLVNNPDGWAKAALCTLVLAPAVPDMATQLRCPECRAVFTQTQGGRPGNWRSLWPALMVVGILLAAVLFAPG